MTILTQTIEQAMLDRSPALHAQLKMLGKLQAFLKETAREVNAQVVTAVQERRMREGWDKLGLTPLQMAGRLNSAQSEAMETVLDEVLQFPQDEISSPSPG